MSLFAQGPKRQDLIALETQFFSAWQTKSLDAVQNNIDPSGVAWSEWGTQDKATQIANQKAANANCMVHSFALNDVRVLPVSPGSVMLLYTIAQDATCGGSPAPTPAPLSNSSFCVRKGGRWVNVYRAFVTPKG